MASAPFVENAVFHIDLLQHLCQKSIEPTYMGLFLDSQVCYVCLPILKSVLRHLDYCSFIACFEIR